MSSAAKFQMIIYSASDSSLLEVNVDPHETGYEPDCERLEIEKYKKLSKTIVEKFGSFSRVRSGSLDVRQTDLWSSIRIVIIEFPNMESAQAFVDSDEYAPVKQIRENNVECTLFIVDDD